MLNIFFRCKESTPNTGVRERIYWGKPDRLKGRGEAGERERRGERREERKCFKISDDASHSDTGDF